MNSYADKPKKFRDGNLQRKAIRSNGASLMDNRTRSVLQKRPRQTMDGSGKHVPIQLKSTEAVQQDLIRSLPQHGGTAPKQPKTSGNGVVQRVGILAALATYGTYLAWGSWMWATPVGLLAAYLVYRQLNETARYHLGLKKTEQQKLMKLSCHVQVRRSQKYNHKTDSYQDDHISMAVYVDGKQADTAGFWMPRDDYKEFTALAISNRGEVRDDKSKFDKVDKSADITIPVTPEQAEGILAEIQKDKKNPPRFSVTGYGGYTCVTWVDKVLKSNGITLHMSNWIVPPSPEHVIPDDKLKTS